MLSILTFAITGTILLHFALGRPMLTTILLLILGYITIPLAIKALLSHRRR